MGPLDRLTAAEYASWFKALPDATRVQIVPLLARRGGPMPAGEIVAAGAGRSTVSAHLTVLAEVRFVLAERRGRVLPDQPGPRRLLPDRRRPRHEPSRPGRTRSRLWQSLKKRTHDPERLRAAGRR